MRHFKQVENDYILYIGIGSGGTEITEKEYNNILSVINNHPEVPEGYGHMLKTDLTWELFELPIIEVEESED